MSKQYPRLAQAAGFEFQYPIAVAERARFFSSWLRRITPDTHQDQAIGVQRLPVALVVSPPQKNYKGFPVEHKLNRSSTCIHVAIPFGVREKVKDCCTTTGHIGPLARTLMKDARKDLIRWAGQKSPFF